MGGRRQVLAVAILAAVTLVTGVEAGVVAARPWSTARTESQAPPARTGPVRVEPAGDHRPPDATSPRPRRPNMVLVLMDDFSMDLLPTMRSAAIMSRRGASYPWSFVVDSLCCVSRTSTFTGQYPHQTGVRLNTPNGRDRFHALGGYPAYRNHGDGPRTFAVRLRRSGYTTGFVGKFLNHYEYRPGMHAPPLPRGWTQFDALFGQGYTGWGFWGTHLHDGRLRLRDYPAPPATASRRAKDRMYVGSVAHRLALDFIDRHRDDQRPWFLEVAPYAPHQRVPTQPAAYPGDPSFPPAFRDRPSRRHPHGNCGLVDCASLGVRDLPGYGGWVDGNTPAHHNGTPAPRSWPPVQLSRRNAVTSLRDRARMAQSVDRMVLAILRRVPRNTYVVLTSDNGLHLGQHALGDGKGSAYDTDIHVPLLVVGPGVRPGPRPEVVSNIDLAPTFEDLAGLRSPAYRSGISLVPTFTHPSLVRQRYTFVEHTWAGAGSDPDASSGALRMVPSYVAVRSRRAVLIRSDLDHHPRRTRFVWEYYELGRAGVERTNTYADPRHPAELATLRHKLHEFLRCGGIRRNEPVTRQCRLLTR